MSHDNTTTKGSGSQISSARTKTVKSVGMPTGAPKTQDTPSMGKGGDRNKQINISGKAGRNGGRR